MAEERSSVFRHRPANPSVIADDDVAAAVRREVELRDELQSAMGRVREQRATKDKEMRKAQPAQAQASAAISAKLDKLEEQRSGFMKRKDELQLRRSKVNTARDQLRILDLTAKTGRDFRDMEEREQALRAELTELQQRRKALVDRLTYKTLGDADAVISKLEQQIAAAQRRNDKAVVGQLTKDKHHAEQARRDVQSSYALDDKVIAKSDEVGAVVRAIQSSRDGRTTVEEERTALLKQIADSKAIGPEMDAIREEINKLNAEAAKLRDERRNARANPKDSPLAAANAAIDELMASVRAAEKEIAALQQAIPRITVPVPADVRGDIVGRNGANVAQLQEDFGVHVDLVGGEAVIVGGQEACEEAKAAVQLMVADAQESRQEVTVEIDKELAPSFIGSRGSNISQIESMSGARVKIQNKSGVVTITGKTDAIAKAKAMVDEFKFQNAQADIPFDPAMLDIVFGKGGATVRRVEKECGLKKLRVDKERSVVVAVGTQAAVEQARAAYTAMLADMVPGGFTMRADDRMARLIIGSQGKTVQDIQQRSGAHIDLRQAGTVKILGTKDAVQMARQLIEEVARREEVKIPFDLVLYDRLTERPLVMPEPDEDGNRTGQQEERNSVLEEIKATCGCDQVSAIRREAKIVIRGKREQVAQARGMLEEYLRTMRPDVATLAVPMVLCNHFKRRAADDATPLDRIRAECPGLLSLRIEVPTHTITAAGDKEAVAKGLAAVQEQLSGLEKGIARLSVPHYSFGTIIGPQGSTIKALQKKHGIDLECMRDEAAVHIFKLLPTDAPEPDAEATAAAEALECPVHLAAAVAEVKALAEAN